MLYMMLKDFIFKHDICISTDSQKERMSTVYIQAGFAFDFYLLKNTAEALRTDSWGP